VYFDNVGGDVFNAVLRLVNPFARIPDLRAHLAVQRHRHAAGRTSAIRRRHAVTIRASSSATTSIACAHFLATRRLAARGALKYPEDVAEGLERRRGFHRLLRGKNLASSSCAWARTPRAGEVASGSTDV
jgi:NADPH-dependent curcumin reductase CurA